MKQFAERLRLAAVSAFVVLRVGSGAVNSDQCLGYTSCASCTGAHYHSSQSDQTSEGFNTEQDEVLDSSFGTENSMKAQSLRGLRNTETSEDLSWPHRRPTCVWCPLNGTCSSKSNPAECTNENGDSLSLQYEYDCPLAPVPYPKDPPSLLPDWMGTLLASGALNNLTLVDLSLPGTHDSITYDLSRTVSDDGLDAIKEIAAMLHTLSGGTIQLLPGELEEFFRLQAKTQQLTITQQLDNGIRFLDVRIMMEDSKLWYSIHFMQSNNPIQHYFQEIRDWLDLHPEEVVVVWLSRHGSTSDTGHNQYPDVSPEEKQELWRNYTGIFDGLMLDTRESSIHTTPVADLISRGHRLVTFASDHDEFTDSSPFALNGAKIQNYYVGDGVFSEPNSLESHMEYLKNASANNAEARGQSAFTLMSMNTAGTSWQVRDAAKNRFLHWLGSELNAGDDGDVSVEGWFKSCSSHTHIPGLNHWCPETLLDISQLTSFYNQVAIESTYNMIEKHIPGVAFPNALYLDALDYDGTIRTGTQTLFGSERSATSASHKSTKYAYVDTILAYNAHRACQAIHPDPSRFSVDSCNITFLDIIDRRRSKYPMQRWEEPAFGRHVDWPF